MTEPIGAWSPARMATGATAYHYTTPSGFLGIVSGGTLRASDASSLNDLSEVTQGRKFTRRRIKQVCADSGPEEVLSRLLEVSKKGHMWHRPRSEFFIACASLEADDAAQWRLYTGPRGGYALHINLDQPLQVVPRDPPAAPRSWNALLDVASVEGWYFVAYGRKEKEELVDDLIAWARRRWAAADAEFRSREQSGWDVDELGAEIAFERDTDLAAAIDLASALMKPKGFRAEREVRTVVSVASSARHVEYRATEEMISRYVQLASASSGASSPLLLSAALPLTGVTIGIDGVYADIKETTRTLLEHRGYGDLLVVPSKVPMRW